MSEMHTLAARHRREAQRALDTNKYEISREGVVIPSMKLAFRGVFETAGPGEDFAPSPNMIVTEGLTHILATSLAQGTQNAAFYIALFSGNVAVANTWTAANFTANATEFTNYDETARVLWAKDAASAGSIGNTSTPAAFTMSSGGGTIRGAALLSASAKSATTGVLIAAARLAADKVMAEAEELRVRYTLTASSS